MPIYDLKCDKCNKLFNDVLVYKRDEVLVCEECGGTLEKQLSTFSTYTIKGDNGSSQTPKRYKTKTKIEIT